MLKVKKPAESYVLDESTSFMTGITVPKPVGFWSFGASITGWGGTALPLYTKPTEQQIRNTEELLGWKWFLQNSRGSRNCC